MSKTVFFGPFLGEFGWEASYWHAWVRKMCRERYKNYRKIAASYLGREPFYQDVDEFWSHPSEIKDLKISQRGYITDFWIKNLPESNVKNKADKNISQYADRLLKKYKEKLPKDTIFYVPHKLNLYYMNGKKYFFGIPTFKLLKIYRVPKTISIDPKHQLFEILNPTQKGEQEFKEIFNLNKRIIALFPRYRSTRRIDKNWQKDKYDLLIKGLQKKYPQHTIGIFGTPEGAYYAEEVPNGCIDLIHLPDEKRFDIQLAALQQSDIAVGSVSGALRTVQLTGCPIVEWGWGAYQKLAIEGENFLKTRSVYWPDMNPSVETIENLVKMMMEKREKEIIYPVIVKEKWDITPYYKEMFFRIVFREIINKLVIFYFKNKKLKEGVI